MKDKRIVLGISGASGMPYAKKLAEFFAKSGAQIFCVASADAKPIFEKETGVSFESFAGDISQNFANVKFFDNGDFNSPIASGSFNFDAMAICPCSMKTLGKLANSIADNLLVRAAEVALKERRKLIIVPRETPLALTQLRNMCALSEAGAIILPAAPAFYQKPESIGDLVDFIVARTISAMGFKQNILKEWGSL